MAYGSSMGITPREESSKLNVTNLALDRTVLANERTYTAWIRTGLAALATGLGIARFMMGTMPSWSIRLIAAFMILFSAAAFLIAAWRYESIGFSVYYLDVKRIHPVLVKTLSLVLAGCSLLSLIGLWYMLEG